MYVYNMQNSRHYSDTVSRKRSAPSPNGFFYFRFLVYFFLAYSRSTFFFFPLSLRIEVIPSRTCTYKLSEFFFLHPMPPLRILRVILPHVASFFQLPDYSRPRFNNTLVIVTIIVSRAPVLMKIVCHANFGRLYRRGPTII